MGAAKPHESSKHSTPKLSLSKLPCKPRDPMQLPTPPLHPSLSIPFRWEEAPGKPRPVPSPHRKNVARCLDLPPRLILDDEKTAAMPSPETVLDGPYVGRSLSLACTFSFRKGTAAEKGGSTRWGSFRGEEEKSCGGDFEVSRMSLGEMLESEKHVKITRVRRRRSFFNLSTVNSNMLGIYASFKHAVPWKRRR